MPDIKGNNKQIFDYLSSQGATGIGENADQFQKYMEKDDNRRQIYDYLSSVNAQGIGNSYDEFTAFVYGGDQQAAPAQAPAAPQEQTQQAGQTAFAPAATQNKQAAEGRAMFDEMRMKKGLKTAAEQAAELPVATEQQEAAQNAPTSSISEHLEQKRRDELVSLNAELEKYKETGDLVDEYERRLDSIKHSLDPQSEKTKEDTKWLQEHKEAYRTTKGSKDMKEYNRIKRRIYDLTVVPALDDVNEQADAINKEIWDLETGPMDSEKTARISELQDAKEIYQMAWQELSQGSKYDEGYEDGNSFKTAIKQYFGSTGRQVDRGTFTLGASEGAATQRARAVGDKYNNAINSAKENLGYSDEDVDALFKSLNDDGNALEEVVAELDSQKSALDAMEATYRDMEKNGASESELDAYAKKYNEKIQEYNQTISDKYQPLESKYEEERGNYDKLMSAIDESVATSLTDGEREILKAFESLINARAVTEEFASTASKGGASFENTLEFMVDFWLTKGLDKAGTKAATKIAKNRAVKKLGAEAVKNMTVRPGIGLNMAKDLGVSVARTAALPTRFAQSLGEQLTQVDNTPYNGKDALGRYQFSRSHENAWANTSVENFIEYWSEGFGEYFGAAEKALFKSTMGSAPKTLIGDTLKKYKGSVGRYLENTKFNGQLNETLEEVVGSGLNALFGFLSNDRVGDKGALEEFAKKENLLTLIVSFLPLSAISSATNLFAYHQMKSRYNEAVEGLNPFIESGAISRGQLDKLADNLSDMTPEQVEEQIVKISDQAREFNEGHLPSDFVKNIMGYLEGTYSMNLRSDDWEDSQEKLSVVNSYSTMYANPQPGFAWDADQQEAEARQNAIDAGFTEEELEQGSYILAQEAREMSETEPERADALLDYANAKAAVEGLENGYRKQGEQIAQANEEEIRSNLDVNGNVVTAVVNEYGAPKVAYITSDDVTIAPDGTVTTPTGNGVVKYRVYENGEYGPESTIMSDKVSEAQAVPTDQYIQMENDAILNGRNELYEQAKKTVSPAGQARALYERVGHTVVVDDHQGVYEPFVVESITDDGTEVVISGDKKALQGVARRMGLEIPPSKNLKAPVRLLYPLLAKENDGTLTTFEQTPSQAETEGNEKAGATSAQQPQEAQEPKVTPDELQDTDRTVMIDGRPTTVHVDSVGGDGVWYTYRDEQGVEREGDMSLDAFTAALVDGQAQAPVAENPVQAPAQTNAFPVDEKTGKRVFDHPSVTPERAYRELMDGVAPGSKNESNRRKFIESSAAKAANALAEAQNKIAGLQARRDAVDEWEINDDEDIDAFEARQNEKRAEFDAQIAEVEAQVPELQRKAAHWAAVRDMAGAVSSERKDAKLVEAADAWTKRTGVKVRAFRTPDEIDDKTVSDALAKGERVGGWYNPNTGEVGLYLPNLADEAEVAKTFIHEVVSHKGLRDMLGKENYDALCDKVWDQLMSEEDRKKYLAYNSHLKGSEEFLRRAAADEWIAHFSETLGLEENKSLFDKFVDFVKEFLDRILGEDAKITKDDIADLLRSSLARYESERKSTADAKPLSMESLPKDIQDGLKEQGKVMDGGVVMDEQQDRLKKETGYKTPNELDMESDPIVGDVRMSKTTMPAWAANYMTYPEAKEHVVKVLENLTDRMAADELVNGVVPRGTYKYGEKTSGSFAGPLRTNIEYVVTFDMDTSCPRSLQYLEYVKQIEAQIGRPLTQRESIQLIEMMRVYGLMIPCVYCYCENKRQALKQYYTDFMTSRHAVISAKTDEEALEHMYGHATNKAAKGSKDPAVALNKAAYKVFIQWRQEKEYNPTLRQLLSQYHHDRNVVLTVLDTMLDNGRMSTNMSDDQVTDAVCSYLGIGDKNAKGAVGDIVSEWKWNRIEDRPHDDFQRIEDEDELVFDSRTLALWREMTLYGKSASSAKNVLRYVPYTDELKTLSQEQRDYINGMGGLRMHSSNDFRIDYVLDYFQFMADMEVNHMMGHTYTKSPEFVKIFGNSGYKINMSIAAYEDSHGIRPNPDEGFDWTTAKDLREKFPNAGVMLMATSDAQIQMALDSDWIDMFIPFHHSGLPKAVWYDMRHWSDYTAKQNEKFLNGEEMREALVVDGVDVPKKANAAEVEKMYNEHFHIRVETYKTGKDKGKRIRPHFLPGPTVVDGVEIPGHNNDYNRYIELCREWGVHPRFYGIKVKDNTPEGGGREVDITEHPAYMKCIKETARTDSPQTAIRFNFDQPSEALGGMTPIDYAMRELEARAASESEMAGAPVRNIYESYKQDNIYGIVPKFIEGIIKHGAEVKERTGKELPLDYLTPDSRRWFMKERKALQEAYKDVDTIPYHPHEYDADGNLIMAPEVQTEAPAAEDGSWTHFRKLEDPAKIEELENGPKVKVYRSMQFIPDPKGDVEYDLGDGKGVQKGFLYAPMSAKVDGKWRDPVQLGRWEEAEENPDMADENGEFILDKGDGSGPMKVAYAPYLHTRRSPLNEQFSSAYKRGNLVIVESEIPESELTSNYTAEKSKKSTGEHDWPSGKVSNALAKKGMDTRKVILSRWAKPVRLVPNSEVADEIVKLLGKSKLAFPYNVVTPGLRSELKSRGVRFKGWQGNKPKNVDELIAEMERADENNVRFRITPEQDKEYMDAVNAGDMATAQEMVDAAAEAAGYTVRGYHGTTHNFTIFDRSKGNAEGDWGKGFYFTTSRDDADVNYGTDEGPDLTNRIELLAENMEWMDGYEDLDYEERLEKAREMLAGDNPHTISAAVRMENPLIIDSHQGAKETFFDYNSGYNYETDEYEDYPSGLLLDFIDAWNAELNEWEWEGNYVSPDEILEYADDGGLTASQLEKKAREILDSAGIQNSAGELASGEFLRSVFERMGFDGIIDENVNIKFGSQRKYGRGMDGMDYDTAHIIAFTPEQIKQTDPVTYDDSGNVIPLSERFNQENEDIRFRVAPNGKQSNLTDEQWKMVRTPEFKAWFGDWENDPANASKVVDENGEPLVVYHGGFLGSEDAEVRSWGADPFKWDTEWGNGWFSVDKNFSKVYMNDEDGEPISAFLNITNPFDMGDTFAPLIEDGKPTSVAYDYAERLNVGVEDILGLVQAEFADEEDHGKVISAVAFTINRNPAFAKLLKKNGYDGATDLEYQGVLAYMTISPNQIKLADPVTYDGSGNVVPLSKRFDSENNDIRFRKQNTPEYEAESQKLFDRAKDHFGTTTDLREAGYVLPDGAMLDFSGRHWASGDTSWLNGLRQVDHRDIKELNYEKDGNTPSGFKTGMPDFIQRGAVRLNSGVINLANKPTRAQEDVIRSVIYRANGDVDVDFGDGNSSEHYVSYDRVAPARVINDIRSYFEDGIKPAGNTRFRKSMSEGDIQKEERIAAAERIVTGKMLDAMPQAVGTGVMRVSRDRMPAGHKTDKGYYDPETNTVSVCMDNVLDERDAVATVLHETVGRKGLRGLFGDRYREFMAGSYAALDAEGRAWVNGYILRNGLEIGDDAVLRGMEEYMARLSEREADSVLDAINGVLSEAVDLTVGTEGFAFTNRELAYMLRASFEHLKDPNWLDTPAGKAKDTLWKRELGINETDPNRPTDPDGPDAGTRFRVGGANATTNYEERMKEKSTIAKMEIQNADIPVKVGYEEILKEKFGDEWEKRMKDLRSDEDYLMRHNLSSSRADTENHNFKLFHFDPMLEKVREVQRKLAGKNASRQKLMDAYERVLDYLYAVSGLERNEWERNNGGEAKDWSGLTSLTGHPKEEWQEAEDDARALVDAFKAEVGDDALLDELWDSIRSCTDFSLDHAYKYGLLTKAEYERLRGTDTQPRLWNYYLPLRGFTTRTAEEEYDYAGIMGSGRRDSDVVKNAKGRWTEADNPLAYIANIAQKEIVQGNENWARQALLRFVRNVGENSLLSERKPWLVKVAGTKNTWVPAEPEENESIEDFEARMQAAKKTGDARQGRKGLELGLVMANKGHRNQHLIHVKVGGEDRMIWVNGNPALARAVSGAGKEPNYEMWRKASRVISNTFTTYSLDFTAKNLLRDSIYSRMAMLAKEDRRYRHKFEKNWWLNGGFTALPMIRLAALWDSGELQRKPASERTPKEQLFIDFMTDGGQTGYTIVRNVEKIKKEMEKVMNPSLARRVIDGAKVNVAGVDVPILGIYTWGVRTMNEAFELLTRFTAYETSREVGRSGQRAAHDAKEISVNFNRRGAQSNEGFWGQLAAFFGGTHYFFNAGVQGFDNFLRLYKTSPKMMTAESVVLMLLGFVTPIINALVSGGGDGDDDKKWYNTDWYWNLPEWVRRNNIVLGRPEEEKVDENGNIKRKKGASYLCIPLPVEFRALYGLGDITNSVFLSHTYANPSPGPGDWSSVPTPGNVFLDILSTASGILPVNPIEGYNGKSVDFKDAVMRSLVPDLFIFGVDWMTNQDYTGRQLKKENMFTPHVPASQGAYTSTPKALVEAAQWMGEHYGVDVAPGVVRDFLSNYGGGFYKFAEDLSKRMFTDDDHPKRWDDIPFLSGFTGHIDEDRTITYVNNVLNEYRDVSENIVKKMNLYNRSDNIKAQQAFVDTDELPAKAKVQALLSGKDYELAKMYYLGMEDEHTGEYARVEHIYQSGKSKGKRYTRKEEIKIPGVKKLKKTWNDAREYWASLPKGTPEEAEAYAAVTNAWHEYYNAAADLAQKLMDYEYGKE